LALLELNLQGFEDLYAEVRQGLLALLADGSALNLTERAEAGRVLSGVGDTRKGVGLNVNGLPDIDWVLIPGGEITLEDNAGTFSVQPYKLARYPVTNRQFQAFIDAEDGYANPIWWEGLAEKSESAGTPGWQDANHPRETVSWYEAMAFCAWLSTHLDLEITLPTEWQWQQAACSGIAEFNYPWGAKYINGYANIREKGHYLGRTTAVGIYLSGNSKQNVSDLSGNIWEWCLNSYKEPQNIEKAGTFARAVRGGCWVNDRDFARSGYRSYYNPGSRYGNLGFRLCCSRPI
jgi:formylglycine-generating enzyme required for sulfatase activity